MEQLNAMNMQNQVNSQLNTAPICYHDYAQYTQVHVIVYIIDAG
jgi:hypothetical protein